MLDLLKAFNKQPKPLEDGGGVKVLNLDDIKPADFNKVEKKLDKANKLLKEITEKRFGGGGGGGGNGSPYVDSNGIIKNVTLVGGRIPIDISIGVPSHFNGSIGTTAKTITPSDTTKSVFIENTHLTQNILISFDGTNYKTIRPYGVYSGDVAVSSFKVKGSGADTTYEGIYTV